jgi:hypothetical protein
MVLGAPMTAITGEISILIIIAVVSISIAIPLFERAITK